MSEWAMDQGAPPRLDAALAWASGHARRPDELRNIVGGGASSVSVSAYNIISRLNAGAVLSGVKGPLAYNYATWPAGTRGDILLIKFASPLTFSASVRNLIVQLPRLVYTASGTYVSLSSSVDVEFDLFYLQQNYDPATIAWNNQPFGLTASGGGFDSKNFASFEADNTTGGSTLAAYSYDNSLDDPAASVPWISSSLNTSFSPNINLSVASIVNSTTFRVSSASDLSWLPGAAIAFTAGPPNGTTATVASATFVSGLTWQIVTTAPSGADTSTAFTAWLTLYGIGIGISSLFGITVAQMTAFASDPTFYLATV